jgi:multiphosphoryl transfer protein
VSRRVDFAFPLPGGLHARPAGLFHDAASRFRSGITFANRTNGRTANARSVLAMVSTQTEHGDACTLRIEGEDEEVAAEGMEELIRDELPLCNVEVPVAPPSPAEMKSLPRALAAEGTRLYRGTSAGKGIARSRALVVYAWDACSHVEGQAVGSVAEEIAKLDRAVARVGNEMREWLQERPRPERETQRAILAAHLAILDDAGLRARMEEGIREGAAAGTAVLDAARHFAGVMSESGSAYLKERVLDIRDIAVQVVRAMYGGAGEELRLREDAVLVAESLTPSQLISLDKRFLKGIVLSEGGATSHTAILARAFNIPCVMGVAGIDRTLATGQELIVDGDRGLVVADPPAAVVSFCEGELEVQRALRARVERFIAAPGTTADGKRLEVGANVGSLEEARLAFRNGAEGIGLFRTELLFMNRTEPPTEEEQTGIYSETARMAGGRPVIVRTLDVGGDKPIPFLGLPAERNPFLGFRAIRMYEEHPEIIVPQLRAILCASAFGSLRIMLPMVSTLAEVRSARALVSRVMGELAAEGVAYDPAIQLGIMVEVPSAAFIIDQLSREVDFFSIGSNDLVQYFLAADRGNEKVAHLYTPFHPAFLRLLKKIVDEGHAHGKWVGLCGEMGGSSLAAPLLVGYGLDEISLASPDIPAMKAVIARCDSDRCRELLESAQRKETAADVEAHLRGFADAAVDRSLVASETVRLGSRSRTKGEAIRELVDLLRLDGRLDDSDPVEEGIWRREEVHSTGVGFGVAIPHCASPDLLADSIAVLRFETPVGWESLDGEPVAIAILIALRKRTDGDEQGDAHLRTIAALSRRLMDDGFRQALLGAADPAEVAALLREATGTP